MTIPWDSRYVERNLIEVTSPHRPDLTWVKMDGKGCTHRWYLGNRPACDTVYNPTATYHVPSLVTVEDVPWIDEDGDEIPQSHLECAHCGETIEPGYRADETRQFITGLVRWKEFSIAIEEPTTDDLTHYMEAFLAGTEITVTHPLGFRIKAFIRSIHTHTKIGVDALDRIDIKVVPTRGPLGPLI